MGVNQLVLSTTQGKLIEVRKRGRLLSISNVVGATTAIVCAVVLLPQWLGKDTIDVFSIFGFASGCFFLSALATLFLAEAPDQYEQAPQTPWQHLVDAWQPIRHDANFRRLAFVSAMYGVSLILFPHYQAVARSDLGMPLDQLLWWLVLQNAGMALFSFILGPIADRYGNRMVLNILMLGLCGAPGLSLILSWYGQGHAWLYNFVFVLVGLTPITIKTLHNYTLEICGPAEHPRYLSSISLCMAAPLVLMLPLGGLLEHRSLDVLFMVGIALMLCGWWTTFTLSEPREKSPPPPTLSEELQA
jgi:predicted MFS family arabinose efflux permease